MTFSENPILPRKWAIISETILARRPGKKHSIAIELFFRQHAMKFELTSAVCALEIKKSENSCFSNIVFLRITFELRKLAK